MLAFFETKVSEEAPSRNWDGPDVCDIEDESEEDVSASLEKINVVLRDIWVKDVNEGDYSVKAAAVALRGAGTALLRSMYSDAIVQGVVCLENDQRWLRDGEKFLGKKLSETNSVLPLCFVAVAEEGHLAVIDCGCTVLPSKARSFVNALFDMLAKHIKTVAPFKCDSIKHESDPCAVAVFDSICAPLFRTLDRTRAIPPIVRYVSSATPTSLALKDVPVECLECPNVLDGVGAAFILRSVFNADQNPHTVIFTSVVETRRIDVESVVALAPCLLWWLRSLGFSISSLSDDRASPVSVARVLSSLPWNRPSDLFA